MGKGGEGRERAATVAGSIHHVSVRNRVMRYEYKMTREQKVRRCEFRRTNDRT